jgi:hypothetical protein
MTSLFGWIRQIAVAQVPELRFGRVSSPSQGSSMLDPYVTYITFEGAFSNPEMSLKWRVGKCWRRVYN